MIDERAASGQARNRSTNDTTPRGKGPEAPQSRSPLDGRASYLSGVQLAGSSEGPAITAGWVEFIVRQMTPEASIPKPRTPVLFSVMGVALYTHVAQEVGDEPALTIAAPAAQLRE